MPSRPSSSPIAAKIMSVEANGISVGTPCDRPEPPIPPVDMPNSDCASW